MKALVSHLLRCNLDQILERSLLHCHLPNMHSIMFLESPEKTIRLFIKEPSCRLDHNSRGSIKDHQTLAFHAHHCDLTLVPTIGEFFNIVVELDDESPDKLGEYRYSSEITGDGIGFKKLGERGIREVGRTGYKYTPFARHQPFVHMKANEIHSVSSWAGEWAAWFALEGKEDPNYDNRCWSYSDLASQNFEGLYQKMNEEKLRFLLKKANLLD